MRYAFCPACGHALSARPLGDDGLVPWCDTCSRPWFDAFSTCVITAVCNAAGEVMLQRERRRPERDVLVAGYMQPGESAEDAALREIREETGLTATSLRYMGSWPHESGDMLMLGFVAQAEGTPREDSCEILSARWVPLSQAIATLREGSIGQKLLIALRGQLPG